MNASRGAMFMLIGMAGLLVVLAVFSGWQGASRLTNRSDDAAGAEAAARAFVEAYGTFDFREPDLHGARLLDLTTGTLHAELNGSETDEIALGQKRVSRSTLVGSSVSALTNDVAAVSVTAEVIRQSTDPESGDAIVEYLLQRINCRLVRQSGQWLVAEFRLESEEPLQ